MTLKSSAKAFLSQISGNMPYRDRVKSFQIEINNLQTKIHESGFEISDLVSFFALVDEQFRLGQLSLPPSMNMYEDQFNKGVRNLGPDKFGINRRDKDGRTTSETVFIGNIYGFHTKPVQFWISHNDPGPLTIMLPYYQTMINDYLGEFSFLNSSILGERP
jgi:hypothetical protein